MRRYVNRASLEIVLVKWLCFSDSDHPLDNYLQEALRTDSRLSSKFKKIQKAAIYLRELRSAAKERFNSNMETHFVQLEKKGESPNFPLERVSFSQKIWVGALAASVLFIVFLISLDLPERVEKGTPVFVTVNKIKDDLSLAPILSFIDLNKNDNVADIKQNIAVPAQGITSEARVAESEIPKEVNYAVSADRKVAASQTLAQQEYASFVIIAQIDLERSSFSKSDFDRWLQQLNPIKAGQVELGWQKAENIFYYHFLFSGQQEEFLKAYLTGLNGTLKWSKDPHPRVLPEGISRIILEIHLR